MGGCRIMHTTQHYRSSALSACHLPPTSAAGRERTDVRCLRSTGYDDFRANATHDESKHIAIGGAVTEPRRSSKGSCPPAVLFRAIRIGIRHELNNLITGRRSGPFILLLFVSPTTANGPLRFSSCCTKPALRF